MAAPHVTSEQLALLAMAADVDPAVSDHVASCRACSTDLSLIRSLLDADGPDAGSPRDGAVRNDPAPTEPPAAAFTAMADGADGPPDTSGPPTASTAAGGAAPGVGSSSSGGSRRYAPAVVALIVAVTLLVAVALLWR